MVPRDRGAAATADRSLAQLRSGTLRVDQADHSIEDVLQRVDKSGAIEDEGSPSRDVLTGRTKAGINEAKAVGPVIVEEQAGGMIDVPAVHLSKDVLQGVDKSGAIEDEGSPSRDVPTGRTKVGINEAKAVGPVIVEEQAGGMIDVPAVHPSKDVLQGVDKSGAIEDEGSPSRDVPTGRTKVGINEAKAVDPVIVEEQAGGMIDVPVVHSSKDVLQGVDKSGAIEDEGSPSRDVLTGRTKVGINEAKAVGLVIVEEQAGGMIDVPVVHSSKDVLQGVDKSGAIEDEGSPSRDVLTGRTKVGINEAKAVGLVIVEEQAGGMIDVPVVHSSKDVLQGVDKSGAIEDEGSPSRDVLTGRTKVGINEAKAVGLVIVEEQAGGMIEVQVALSSNGVSRGTVRQGEVIGEGRTPARVAGGGMTGDPIALRATVVAGHHKVPDDHSIAAIKDRPNP